MHPSRSVLRRVLPVVVCAAVLAACSAAPAPAGAITGSRSPFASATTAAGATVPAVEPVASEPSEPTASTDPEPEPSSEPTDDGSQEPIDQSAPPDPANPTARPIPPAPADCGTEDIPFYRDEVPEVLHFGGAAVEFTTAGIGTRNGDDMADDVIPGGIGLTANEIAVRVDPGTHIILRGNGMSLTNVTARSVSWATVSFSGGPGSSSETPVALAWRFGPNGTISVSAPTDPGDFMVSFGVEWFTHCLKGDGIAYGRIKVNG